MTHTLPCHYHSNAQAIWECKACHRRFCNQCVPLNDNQPYDLPSCPLCGLKLLFLGSGGSATPFWQKITFFFRYALGKEHYPFYLLAVAGGFLADLSLIFQIIYLCVLLRYCQAVLENNSHNNPENLSLLTAISPRGLGLFIRLIGICLFMAVTLFLCASYFGSTATSGLLLLYLISLPATMIILAKEDSFWEAISPSTVFSLIFTMGLPYLILLVFTTVILSSYAFTWNVLVAILPAFFTLPLATLLLAYFLVVLSTMMGYAVYQYRDQLGYSGNLSQERPPGYPVEEWRWRNALATSEIQLKEGHTEAALSYIRTALEKSSDAPELHLRYHTLVLNLNRQEACMAHIDEWLPKAAIVAPEKALVLLADAQKLKPDFLPADPATCERLAKTLVPKDPRKSLLLLCNLHKRFPDYPDIPRAYLLAARCLSEKLGQIKPASELLTFVLHRYPQSPVEKEIIELQNVLSKIQH